MTKTAGWHIYNYALVVNYHHTSSHPTFLLIRHGNTFSLPRVTLAGNDFWPRIPTSGEDFWHSVEVLNKKIQRLCGIRVTALRCLFTHDDDNRSCTVSGWVMESHGSDGSVHPDMGWFTEDDIAAIRFSDIFSHDLVRKWIVWKSDSTLLRVPWSQPGWFSKMERMLPHRLKESGYSIIEPIVQLRVWERSSILRAATNKGALYIKAVPAVFAHEVYVTKWLAQHYARMCPPVLDAYHDDVLGYQLITLDHRGIGLDTIRDSSVWRQVIRAYSDLQVQLVEHTSELITLGCPVRPLADLPAQAAAMAADSETLKSLREGLTDDEIVELQQLLPTIRTVIKQLSLYNIPLSLEHGDLWSGQIAIPQHHGGDNYVFIDWSDCSITHPFISTYFFLEDAKYLLSHDPNAYTQLRDVYLSRWEDYESSTRLQDIFECIKIVAPLHHAIMYYTSILPRFEFRWEMEFMFTYHLRALLSQAKKTLLNRDKV